VALKAPCCHGLSSLPGCQRTKPFLVLWTAFPVPSPMTIKLRAWNEKTASTAAPVGL